MKVFGKKEVRRKTWALALYVAVIVVTILGFLCFACREYQKQANTTVALPADMYFLIMTVLMGIAVVPFLLCETELYICTLYIFNKETMCIGNMVYRIVSLLLSVCMIVNLFYNDHSQTIKYQEIRWILLVGLYLSVKFVYWAVNKNKKT